VKTPCIKVCKVLDGKCLGCGRTLEQIRLWSKYTDEERERIMKMTEMEKLLKDLFSLLDREEVNDDGELRRVTQIYCSREADRIVLTKVLTDLKIMVS
jgi:predicted Fe-S protein YdhL (DUF1289 family)